ncbi:MAG: hypothetical protein R2726_07100 [Acidimicrobiales bacterium]
MTSDRAPLLPDPGSFRDPTSRVFVDADHDRVVRAMQPDAFADLRHALDGAFLPRAIADRRVVATTPVDDPRSAGLPETWTAAVEHPRLHSWSYPYEWTFSMLRDAAVLQLELLRDALAEDLAFKDATPYNVQFDGALAQFVDVGSIERLQPGDPWFGYLQFCQQYLYPLLVTAYADLPFQPLLRGSIDGVTPEIASRLLGPLRLPRRGVLVHVALHARAQARFADTDADVGAELKQGGMRKELIEANVRGLLRTVTALRWKRSESAWSTYTERAHYTDADLRAKEAFVGDVAGRRRWSIAWDVGCNDGRFSELIAPQTDRVVAFDADHLVVDLLYRRLAARRDRTILPLVVDLTDPSPGLGWANVERPAFLERNRPELVLALAVIHHLAITGNVPTARVLDLFAGLGAATVLEVPTEDDPKVRQLLRNKRAGVHDDYRLERIEAEIGERFDVGARVVLPSQTRVLFELAPR